MMGEPFVLMCEHHFKGACGRNWCSAKSLAGRLRRRGFQASVTVDGMVTTTATGAAFQRQIDATLETERSR